ncbi:MAG: SDR family NAD(P)-dependent oxidoreductase [Bdellovibrionales bacterium]|nr:SDR family NAD(P)-dependent oxidoreductase [Bdellovibrionales bacterium]
MRDKRVWLTGASSGIGEGLALELARRGARVALTARSEESLAQLCDRIKKGGGDAVVCAGDVTDTVSLKRAYSALKESFGGADIVIANAGTHFETWPEREFLPDQYLDLMNINYGGMLRTFGVVLPEMTEAKKGHLVGVASLAGYRGLPRAAAYGASKAAMILFLESMRFHLESVNVAVTTVCPGFVKTPLTDKNTFSMPFLTDVESAARIICDGIERKKECITFPFPFNWFMSLVRILPNFLFKPLARAAQRKASE